MISKLILYRGSSPALLDPSLASESDTDSEDAMSLQFSQLTLPQFTMETLSKILPVLKTSNPEVMLAGMQLLHEVIQLMQISMTTDIWEDKSVVGRNLVRIFVFFLFMSKHLKQ